MYFNQYKTNINQYLDRYYGHFRNQFKGRTKESFQKVFNDEAANLNRYILGIINEIKQSVRRDLEDRFGYEQGDKYYDEFKMAIPLFEVEAYQYQIPEEMKRTSLTEVKIMGEDHTSSTDRKHQTVELDNKKAATTIATTAIIGGSLGWKIAPILAVKVITTPIGLAAGAAVGLYLASRLLNERSETPKRRWSNEMNIPLNSSSVYRNDGRHSSTVTMQRPILPSIEDILNERRGEIEKFLYRVVDELEELYESIGRK